MVHDFTYYTPTKVVFGKDATDQVGLLVKEFERKSASPLRLPSCEEKRIG